MKYTLLIILSLILSTNKVFAQIETRYFQNRDALDSLYKQIHPKTIYHLPTFDLKELQKEDAELENCDVPYRFGKGFDVSYTLSDGEWQDVEGGRLWSITFESSGALSLNFILENVQIPEGGYLYVVNQERTTLYGPVYDKNIGKNRTLMTDVIPGTCANLLLFEPNERQGTSSINIKKIVHGYRSIENEFYGQNGSSATCNIDIACRPDFEQESKAVGLVLLSSGTERCSGSLIMSTDCSLKPYFLTAFHCIDYTKDGTLSVDEIDNAENWMFKFYHKKIE